jgi:hypothetical protein
MKSIAFFGCSWTYGVYQESTAESRFTRLISDDLRIKENNFAKNGNSNYDILRSVVSQLEDNYYDVCVIQLTGMHRLTIPFMDKLYTLRYSDCLSSNSLINKFGLMTFHSNKNNDVYFNYYYPMILSVYNYCLNKNSLPIFFCLENLLLEKLVNKNTNISLMRPSLKDYIPEVSNKDLYVDKKSKNAHHPNTNGHLKLKEFFLRGIEQYGLL